MKSVFRIVAYTVMVLSLCALAFTPGSVGSRCVSDALKLSKSVA